MTMKRYNGTVNKLRQKIAAISLASSMIGVGGVGSYLIAEPVLAACGCLPVASPVWQAASESIYATQSGIMIAGFEDLKMQWTELLNAVTGSLKVFTKQIDLAATRRSDTDNKLVETQAQIDKDLVLSKRMYEALRDYGPMSQGHNPCDQIDKQRSINESLSGVNDSVLATKQSVLAAAPGKYADPAKTLSTLSQNRAQFCRPELVAQGVCTSVSADMAGRDTNPTVIFDQKGANDAEAAKAYLNYFAGTPNAAPPKNVAKNTESIAYMEAKRNRDALVSPAIHSVATVKAWSAPDGPLAKIDERVNEFVGGDGYKDFKVYVHSGQARGLLLQYAKMSALELQMRYLQYDQLQRIETNLAAMTAASTYEMQKDADAAAAKLSTDSATQKVK